jgi:uncharacterized small protein (DUF1192 family)
MAIVDTQYDEARAEYETRLSNLDLAFGEVRRKREVFVRDMLESIAELERRVARLDEEIALIVGISDNQAFLQTKLDAKETAAVQTGDQRAVLRRWFPTKTELSRLPDDLRRQIQDLHKIDIKPVLDMSTAGLTTFLEFHEGVRKKVSKPACKIDLPDDGEGVWCASEGLAATSLTAR